MEEEEAEEDEKPEYFFRMLYLVFDLGTEVLLKLFKKYIPQGPTVEDFLNSVLKGQERLFNKTQREKLYKPPLDVSSFDISLLSSLISKFTYIQQTNKQRNQSPNKADSSAGAHVTCLVHIRNEACHRSKCGMKKSDFEKFWKSAENILVDLAGEVSQTEIDHVKEKIGEIKTKQIGKDQRCKLKTQLKRKRQEDIDLLKLEIEEKESRSEDVDILKVQLKDLENDMKKIDDIWRKYGKGPRSQMLTWIFPETVSLYPSMAKDPDLSSDIKVPLEGEDYSSPEVDLDIPRNSRHISIDPSMAKDPVIIGDIEVPLEGDYKRSLHIDLNIPINIKHVSLELRSDKLISSQHDHFDEHERRLQALEQVTFHAKEKVNDQMKHNLQKELVDHYRRNGYCKTTITPLNDDEQVEIKQLFVEPIFKRVKHDSFSKASGNENEEKDTESTKLLEDILRKERRVCVSGNAGQGKTTLCQKIVSSWCSKVYDNNEPEPDSIYKQLLKPFDYLFYIHLRNHSISDVVEMIETDIVRKASRGVLKEVLENESEKCLIILDGLDEWMPPKDCKHKVPYIDEKEKFTVLITSRPWKLEKLRPKESEIGQEVTLCGIDQTRIVKGIFNILNKKYGKFKDWDFFISSEQYMKGKHLAEIPMILKQMVCMWYDGEEFGNTRVDIYCKMMEYLFNVAFKRGGEGGKDTCKSLLEPQESTNAKLVNVFKDCSHCKEYSELLSKLSKLAYHTLFSEEKESSLVFRHSDDECKELTESDVDFCVTVGILSQSTLSGKVVLQQKRLSFLHKTFQEFLAAIFIAYRGEEARFHSMLERLISLDDVLEMSEVLIFLSGLNPDLIGDMSRRVATLTDKDERVQQYRSSFRKENYFISPIQDIIRAFIDEVPKDKKMDCKVALNDYSTSYFDIDRDEKMIPYVDLENVKSFQYRFVIQKGCFVWTELSGHDIAKLCVEINSQEHVCHLTSIVERCVLPLQCLSVEGPHVMDHVYSLNDLLIALNKVCHFTCIELSYMKLAHSEIKNLEGFLSHKTELKEIVLDHIWCTTCEQGHCKYMIDLSHHKQLEYLKLCSLHGDIVLNKQLQYLELCSLDGDIVLSDEVALEHFEIINVKCEASIINKLKLSASLQELEIWAKRDNTTATVHSVEEDKPSQLCSYKEVIDVIPTLKNLRTLELRYTDFKKGILKSSPDMTSLKDVFLHNCTMTLQCLQSLIDSLLQIQIRVGGMYDVRICPKGDLATAVEYITDRFLVVCEHDNSMKLTGKSFKQILQIKGNGDDTENVDDGSMKLIPKSIGHFKGDGDDTENDEDDSMCLEFRPRH